MSDAGTTNDRDDGRDPLHEPSDEGQAGEGGEGSEGGKGGEGSAPSVDAGTPAVLPGGCVDGPIMRLLFIGNSHTFTNDLPAQVRELACSAGTQVIAAASTPGGVGFAEHAVDPTTLAAIDADDWDFVIMQDQQQRPSFRLEDVESDELPALVSLVDAIAAHRAETRPLLFMVWARRDGDPGSNCAAYPMLCSFETTTISVEQGYRLYAERTGAEVAPVALAWAAVRADPDAPFPPTELWMSDGSHPNLTGSYLAAAVLVGTLLERPTAQLGYEAGLGAEVSAYLRGVADRTVRDERADPRVVTDERVRIDCAYGAACDSDTDATAVTFSLSTDDCDALTAGEAEVRGRIDTTLSCRGSCTTVALGAWHELTSATTEDGDYNVHVQVDLDGDGELGDGDLEACSSFAVGGGEDLVFDALSTR